MDTNALGRELAPEVFAAFRDLIQRHSGIFLEDSKSESLRTSLATRASLLQLADYGEYLAALRADEKEFGELMNLVTINETSFFRFVEQFDALRDRIAPELLRMQRSDGRTGLNVWSAGCSTGEEAYTIAMSLLESEAGSTGARFEILGTDVSTSILEVARRATYPAKALSSVPEAARARWFEPVGDRWRPAAVVRRSCAFRYHNLVRDAPPQSPGRGWDLIFCRNVTIYFRPETTQRVVERFFDALNPGGYLFLGHSETLTSASTRFETVEAGGVYVYRKPLGDTAASGSRRPGESRTSRVVAGSVAPGLSARSGGVVSSKPAATTPAAATTTEERAAVAEAARHAHRLLEEARPAEALAVATSVLANSPGDLEAQLVVAFAHADLGDLDRAAAEATGILEQAPLTAPASYLLGAIHRQQGRIDDAVIRFRRTLYIDPDFVLAHFALAGIEHQQGAYADAVREYENTLRALHRTPEGDWTAFLGGFRPDLLAATCERGLAECRRFRPAKGTRATGR